MSSPLRTPYFLREIGLTPFTSIALGSVILLSIPSVKNRITATFLSHLVSPETAYQVMNLAVDIIVLSLQISVLYGKSINRYVKSAFGSVYSLSGRTFKSFSGETAPSDTGLTFAINQFNYLTVSANAAYLRYRLSLMDHISTSNRAGSQLIPPGPNRLVSYERLPDSYANDPVFSRYVCELSGKIVRFPCKILGGEVSNDNSPRPIYELSELLTRIESNDLTHPLAHEPLPLIQLEPDYEALKAIQNRMEELKIPLTKTVPSYVSVISNWISQNWAKMVSWLHF